MNFIAGEFNFLLSVCMRYLIAILLPPLAVLLCGKPVLAILNILLTLCLWLPGVIHAMVVVGSHKADARAEKLAATISRAQNGG